MRFNNFFPKVENLPGNIQDGRSKARICNGFFTPFPTKAIQQQVPGYGFRLQGAQPCKTLVENNNKSGYSRAGPGEGADPRK